MKKYLIVSAAALLFAACKKERQCECRNSFGTYLAGEIKGSRSAAKKTCESMSAGDTECYLK